MGAVADARNDTGFAMLVPVLFFVLSWSYALCVNFVPAYRDTADKIGASNIGLDKQQQRGDEEAAVGAKRLAGSDEKSKDEYKEKAEAKEIEMAL